MALQLLFMKYPAMTTIIICYDNKESITNASTDDKKEADDVATIRKGNYQYAPKEGFVLTHFLTVADVKLSADFYLSILGGKAFLRHSLLMMCEWH
jgi:hypothetical protein